MDERLRNAPVGILDVSPDGYVRAINPAAADLLQVDAETAGGESLDAVFPASVEERVPRALDTPLSEERSFEEYYPDLDCWLTVSLVPHGDAVSVYLRDRTAAYRTERRLEAVRDDLDRSTITNELVGDILAELVAASTREEIAETICTQLGETDIYEFAWVGEREVGTGDIVVRATAGTTNRTLQCIEAELENETSIPELRAIESGTPESVHPLGEEESVPEPIRRAAFADGVQSLLAVPLRYGSSVYGVVGIYVSDRDGFTERERSNFDTVGEMAGFAINATRNRSLLLSDTVVELTFRLTDHEAPFVAAATELEATLSVEGLVPDADQLLCYLEVETNAPDIVERTLRTFGTVTGTRLIGTHDDEVTVEATLAEATPLGQLVSQGATLQSATYGEDGARIVVELPPDEDIRRIADAFTRQYDATVAAKREHRRDNRTASEFRNALDERLTDRQRTVLRTAFFANYFESPRDSTAEEVATSLDITGPTLLHHLRAGQRKLLAAFFDAGDP
ncbi:bacterio-opsin activator domain-containing protein [Halorientalis halophila]|uniref:bacterio-opsin activator domain-containing protein n=1 Tax=Halorientalis halophila TaxID=3108499 RepID=UPI003009C65C